MTAHAESKAPVPQSPTMNSASIAETVKKQLEMIRMQARAGFRVDGEAKGPGRTGR